MLTKYIDAAMERARYEIMEDGEGFFGSIPELESVWAEAKTLEECRAELKSVVEDWLLLSLSRQMPIPVIGGVDLTIREVA